MSEVRKHRNLTRKQLAVFERVFGELELRYTPTRIYSSLRGDVDVVSYEILGVNDWSVVIATTGAGSRSMSHLHFAGSRYWISLGGVMREYFRRAPKAGRS
jgi:hypothetical protein